MSRLLRPRQPSGSAYILPWPAAIRRLLSEWLSDVTGVPRESVRRKLKRLAERGWVTQDPTRGWSLAGSLEVATARIDLGDLDRRGLERLGMLMTALMPILSENMPGPREAENP